MGTFENNIEQPRIQVTLATAISPEACRRVGLGYVDPEHIDFSQFQGREDEDILFVEKAGETLFLLENSEVDSNVNHSLTKM